MSRPRSQQPAAPQGLLNAAGAVLARNPGAANAEIAVKAGLGRATLYRSFPTRQDLIPTPVYAARDAAEDGTVARCFGRRPID